MLKIHHSFFIFFALLLTIKTTAQNSSIQVNARAQKDKIVLRWAVNSPIDWQKANTSGFKLNKMLIKKDGVLLANPVKKELAILKAEPLEQWMEFIQKDNYGAIVAQALYGDAFEVGQENEDTLTKIVSTSDELNQRFSFALFAADLSFEAAIKAGWGYIDTEVQPNEVYVYQVEAINLPNINTGAYMLGLSDHEELPKVTDFTAIPDDKQIMLSWGVERLNNVYTAYMIERWDEDGGFIPISQTNIVNINTSDIQNNKQMFYGNKIEANNQNYFYRIYGINSFGEKGPYSNIIQTQGVASVVVAPRIIDYVILNPNEVVLEWEFPVEEEKNINAFELHYAQKDLSDYEPVAHHINKSDRKFHYKGLSASNYFKVAVVDQQNNKLFSQSTLVQPIDSIPPSKPLGLTGQIDSLGYVKLTWKPNTEKDLAGYRVLRANAKNEEFVDIFNKVITTNFTIDTVSFAISNKKVYYKILAEDLRYNRSDLSDILIIDKPDKLPPTAPVFKDYETSNGKNILFWVASSSDDVEKYYLKRRIKGENHWLELAVLSNKDTQYTDKQTEADVTYEYLIQAKDLSGLYSNPENSTITLTTVNNSPISVLKNIETIIDRENKTATLYWNYNTNYQVTEIQIYKNSKGEKPSLWKVLDAKFLSITDKDLKMNTEYEYHFLPTITPNRAVKGEKIKLNY